MAQVLLVVQLIISIILTFLILIQRSEGGALGIGGGGGGGGGGFMSGRSATNSVSRMTGILGAAFIINCMVLSVVFNNANQEKSITDAESAQEDEQAAKKRNLIGDSNAEEGLTFDSETPDKANPLEGDAVVAPETTETPEVTVETTPEPAAEDRPEDE